MKNTRKLRPIVAAVAALVLPLSLAACGGGLSNESKTAEVEAGSIDAEALSGEKITVGSKDFDEQLLLGQVALLALKAAGAEVTDKTNIAGSTATRNALKKGDIDVYWDYTGTAWITYLGHEEPIADSQGMYDAVAKEDLAKNKLVWGQMAPMNNTYAMAVTKEFGEKNNLKTLSDMAAYVAKTPGATACIESEFAGRADGYDGMLAAYGIQPAQVQAKKLGTGVIYTQLDKGNCDFGEVFTTDGRNAALGLVPLEDDKAFFPLYNLAPIVTQETDKSMPEILEVLAPISEILTTEKMTELNKQVSSDGEKPEKVAEEFLKDEGFIK